ncbi:MAG TPA: lysozyme inhibitor LprI family protein [Devosiaceae bacterium]
MNFRHIAKVAVFLLTATVSLLMAGSPFLVMSARAASFDCAKAGGGIETMICDDQALSALDSKLEVAYKGALAAAHAAGDESTLAKEQRNWLRYTRALCQDSACLTQAYASRIEVLARNEPHIIDESSCETPTGSKECISVVVERDPNSRIDSFNQTLVDENESGKLVGCTMLLKLPGMSTNSNATYGGSCVLQTGSRRTDVKICNDDMIGRFGMEPIDSDKEQSNRDLLDFANQCPGG